MALLLNEKFSALHYNGVPIITSLNHKVSLKNHGWYGVDVEGYTEEKVADAVTLAHVKAPDQKRCFVFMPTEEAQKFAGLLKGHTLSPFTHKQVDPNYPPSVIKTAYPDPNEYISKPQFLYPKYSSYDAYVKEASKKIEKLLKNKPTLYPPIDNYDHYLFSRKPKFTDADEITEDF